MYSRSEATRLKQEFWTAFGLYMAPVSGADGEKVSWVNYKTGKKYLFFRMQADGHSAAVSILITHPDKDSRERYYNQFLLLKTLLATKGLTGWEWQPHATDEAGKTISTLSMTLAGVSIYNKADWPALISFFKNNIMAVDEFWSQTKYGFDTLL